MTPFLWYMRIGRAHYARTQDDSHADLLFSMMVKAAPDQWQLWYRWEP